MNVITTFIFALILIGITVLNWKNIKDDKREKIWFFSFVVLSLSLSILFSFQLTLHRIIEMMNNSIGGITEMVLRL